MGLVSLEDVCGAGCAVQEAGQAPARAGPARAVVLLLVAGEQSPADAVIQCFLSGGYPPAGHGGCCVCIALSPVFACIVVYRHVSVCILKYRIALSCIVTYQCMI